jgi:hypothetical protein
LTFIRSMNERTNELLCNQPINHALLKQTSAGAFGNSFLRWWY